MRTFYTMLETLSVLWWSGWKFHIGIKEFVKKQNSTMKSEVLSSKFENIFGYSITLFDECRLCQSCESSLKLNPKVQASTKVLY